MAKRWSPKGVPRGSDPARLFDPATMLSSSDDLAASAVRRKQEMALDQVLGDTPGAMPSTPALPPSTTQGAASGLWGAFDKSVLTLFETLGLLFGLPFGEDLYKDQPVTDSHLRYFWIGLMFAASGPFVSYFSKRFSNRLANTIRAAANNFYVWLVLVLVLFVYGAVRDFYPVPAPQTAIMMVPKADADARRIATLIEWLQAAQNETKQIEKERDQLKQQLVSSTYSQIEKEDLRNTMRDIY